MASEEQKERLFQCMKVMQSEPGKKIQELTKGEMEMLRYLSWEHEEATPTELSVRLKLSTARVANTLNSLEKKTYIERIHDVADRRRVLVHITEKGRSIFEEKHREVMDDMGNLLDDLGEKDGEELIRLIEKVIALVEKKKKCEE